MEKEKLDEEQERFARRAEKVCGKRAAEDDQLASHLPKRFKYLENPFRAQRSTYDWKLLEINNPFLETTTAELKHMPPDNVRDGRLMDKAALRKSIDVLLRPVVHTSMQYKRPTGELGGGILHASLLQNIKMLTPSSGNLQIVAGGKKLLQSDEVDDDEGDEGDVLDRYDLKGRVHDTRLNVQVTVIIIECDRTGDFNKLYQGCAYAIPAAICNMRKGRYEPIYIHNWSSAAWRYGVLRCKGVVTVKRGLVAGVRLQEQLQDSEREALIQSLDSKLKEYTTKLQEDYLSAQCYPDGEYLLGSVHLCVQSLDLPVRFGLTILSPGAIRFVSSLIRTFVGDEALSYTKEDIEANISKRETEMLEVLGRYTSGFDLTYRLAAELGRGRTTSGSTVVHSGRKHAMEESHVSFPTEGESEDSTNSV